MRKTASSDIPGIELTQGRVLYCPRSTPVNPGGLFAACCGDNGIPDIAERTDEHGRTMYFVAGDRELIERHILSFILTRHPSRLPPFSEARELWRDFVTLH